MPNCRVSLCRVVFGLCVRVCLFLLLWFCTRVPRERGVLSLENERKRADMRQYEAVLTTVCTAVG
jgi:hypothetical protein